MSGTVPTEVRVGGVTKPALLDALREHRIQLNEAAEHLFAHSAFKPIVERQVIEIVALSVADLGFGEGATYTQLVERARQRGLDECPLELGPHLRLQFLDQPESECADTTSQGRAPKASLTIASPPLDDDDDTPRGFYVRRVGDVLWLRGYWSSADHLWSPEDVLVFARAADARVLR